MRIVTVRQLSRETAATLKKVRNGESLLVTTKDQPIAVLSDLPDEIALRELPLRHPRVRRLLERLDRHSEDPAVPAGHVVARLRKALAAADRRATDSIPSVDALIARVAALASVNHRRARGIVNAVISDVADILRADDRVGGGLLDVGTAADPYRQGRALLEQQSEALRRAFGEGTETTRKNVRKETHREPTGAQRSR